MLSARSHYPEAGRWGGRGRGEVGWTREGEVGWTREGEVGWTREGEVSGCQCRWRPALLRVTGLKLRRHPNLWE